MTSTSATDAVVLDRSFAVGAYWGPRAADPTTCAQQVLHLLHGLTALEPTLGQWGREDGTVESAALSTDPQTLGAQLLERTRGKQVGGGIDGYFVADGIAVAVRLGMTSPHVGNAVFLKPGRQPKSFWLTKGRALVTTLVDVLEPSWAIAGPSAFRKAQKAMPEPDIGAITYLTGQPNTGSLPALADVSEYGSGVLIDLTNHGLRLPTVSEVLEVRAAIFEG